jgi:hypothetical protein
MVTGNWMKPDKADPMPYTLGQAAKAAGRTKTTLQEAIKKGRISATKDALGRYQIDPAELHRVYAPVTSYAQEPDAAMSPLTAALSAEIRRLNDKVELLERLYSQVEGERNRLLAVLPAPRPPRPPRRPWWSWLMPYPSRTPSGEADDRPK